MLILAIETSTTQSSVALANQTDVLASASIGLARRHGEFVTPAVEFCLEQIGASVTDITGVACGLGPGSYTGLRVGIATAQTMAMALRVPVVGLSGLDVVAFQMRHVSARVCAAIDARRKQLFWAFYDPTPGGVVRVGDMCVGTPDELGAEIAATAPGCLVVGDGGVAHAARLRDAGAHVGSIEQAYPRAGDLAELAVPRFLREETGTPVDLQPVYLRQADAKIGWAQRGSFGGATT